VPVFAVSSPMFDDENPQNVVGDDVPVKNW
jgi:hypothetical protein